MSRTRRLATILAADVDWRARDPRDGPAPAWAAYHPRNAIWREFYLPGLHLAMGEAA